MLIQRKGTSAVSIYLEDNDNRVELQPGNIYNVSAKVYDGLKNLYGSDIEKADNEDRLQVVEKTITTAEVLALNTTPVQLIPAVAGNAIVVEKVVASVDYASAAYETNTELEFKYDDSAAGDAGGAEVTAASLDAFLTATADKVSIINGLGAAEAAPTIGKGVSATVATGDPETGDSDIKVRVYYRIAAV